MKVLVLESCDGLRIYDCVYLVDTEQLSPEVRRELEANNVLEYSSTYTELSMKVSSEIRKQKSVMNLENFTVDKTVLFYND